MAISIQCECGKSLVAKDQAAGKTATCPACGKTLKIPAANEPVADDVADGVTGASATDATAASASDVEPVCPACGEPFPESKIVCNSCSYSRRLGKQLKKSSRAASKPPPAAKQAPPARQQKSKSAKEKSKSAKAKSTAGPKPSVPKMIGGGLVGGIVGVAAWIGVGLVGYEVGWIAWLVGAGVGLGVRVFNLNNSEVGGAVAVPIAALMVVLGKYGTFLVAAPFGASFGDMFSGYDIVWFPLAGLSAAGLAFIGADDE